MTATGGEEEEARALTRFHDLTAKAAASVRDEDVTADENGMTMRICRNRCVEPHPIPAYAGNT